MKINESGAMEFDNMEMRHPIPAFHEAPPPPPPPHHIHERHIPPHLRRDMLRLEFDEEDMEIFNKVFGDEDTAMAAVNIIRNAPPEIKVLTVQAIEMIKEAA